MPEAAEISGKHLKTKQITPRHLETPAQLIKAPICFYLSIYLFTVNFPAALSPLPPKEGG